MEEFDFETLAKELIVEHLKTAENAPMVAADIVKKISIAAVNGTALRQEPRISVSAACRGVMGGMILLEADLPETAVAVLREMATVAAESNQDPMECMTWAMEGMATVCRLASPDAQEAVRVAIDEKFMGAGEVFEKLLRSGGV